MNKIGTSIELLNKETNIYRAIEEYPIKVLQIGEGNFLRGFFDWMIHECIQQGNFKGSVAVTQPRPSGKVNIEKLKAQDGLYTLLLRGLQNGQKVEKQEIISVFSKVLNPYEDWSGFLRLAENPSLEFVVSNTTEAGLSYQKQPWEVGEPISSFPGKITAFLYRRFEFFKGDTSKGLILLPCELLERNGDILRNCVIKHSKDWGLSKEFIEWVEQCNLFLNSLVDRIVTGFPDKEAELLFSKWNYKDQLLNTAEPYHFWAIEGDQELEARLPLKKSGLNVKWVKDLAPYQLRKVRILNASHTIMASIGILSGIKTVGEWMNQPERNEFLWNTIKQEIIPTLDFDQNEVLEYAENVMERFMNPFVQHRLADISLNNISKFKSRLLPTIESYYQKEKKLPPNIIRALAGLIRFYKVEKKNNQFIGQTLNGEPYFVHDQNSFLTYFSEQWSLVHHRQQSLQQLIENILGQHLLWDKNLNKIDGLSAQILEAM